METLTVIRNWKSSYNQTSILTDSQGHVKAIINSSLKQPHKGDKTIVIRGKEYELIFAAKENKNSKK